MDMKILVACCFVGFALAIPSNSSKNASLSDGKWDKSDSNAQLKLPQSNNKTGSLQHYQVIEKPDGSLETVHLDEFRSSDFLQVRLQCVGLRDGLFADPLSPCVNRFYRCERGTAVQHFCPTGFVFSSKLRDCVDPQKNFQCRAPVPLVEPFNCVGHPDGNYENPAHSCREIFFSCVSGASFVRLCSSATLRYDAMTDQCLSPAFVKSCGGTPQNSSDAAGIALKASDSKAQTPFNLPKFDCGTRKDGNYQHPTEKCSATYFVCKNGIAELRTCADSGARYDSFSNSCLRSEFIKDCGGSTTTAPNVPRVALVEVKIAADFCFKRPDRNYALETGICDHFFIACAGGKAVAWQCPEGTAYDEKFDRCEFPALVAACGGSPTTPKPILRSDVSDVDCKTDGDFGLGCNQSFVTCSNGQRFLKNCANKQTRFDQVSGKCLFPKFVEACGGMQSTTAIPKTTKPVYLFDCHQKPQGNYPDPRNGCSHTFFICSGDKFGVERDCVGNTYFDQELDQCLYHSEVPACTGAPRPDTTTVDTSITSTTVETTTVEPEEVVDFDCSTKDPGQYPNYHEKNCSNIYFTCRPDGVAKLHKCPGETYYDQELNQCLFFEQVPECTGSPRTEKIHSGNGTTYIDPEIFDCSKESEGNFYPPGIQCANYFYQCAYGKTFKFDCPNALRYHPGQDACLAQFQVPGCPGYVPDEFCSGKINGFYAHPKECSKFFFCVNGTDYSINCPPGEVFSRERFRCRPIAEVDEPCGTRQGAEPESFECQDHEDGTKFESRDCRKFFVCEGGELSTLACGEGMAFSKQSHECDLAIKVTECSPPADTGMASFCEGRTDGLFSYPNNCHLSVICAEKRPFVFACLVPGKPDFDPILKQCVKNVKGCHEN